MIPTGSLPRCVLCGETSIAASREGTLLCLAHWHAYAQAWGLPLAEVWHPQDRQRLLLLRELAGYPEVRVWDWMRLSPGLENFTKFCCWHDNPADTRQAVRKLLAMLKKGRKKALRTHQAEVVSPALVSL